MKKYRGMGSLEAMEQKGAGNAAMDRLVLVLSNKSWKENIYDSLLLLATASLASMYSKWERVNSIKPP